MSRVVYEGGQETEVRMRWQRGCLSKGVRSQKRMDISVYIQVGPAEGEDLHKPSLVMPSLHSLVNSSSDM